MRRALIGLASGVVLVAQTGCLQRPIYDPISACRAAQANLPSIRRGGLSAYELAETVAPDARAFKHAKAAYDQGNVWIAMTAIGSALLVGGLVTGFAVDTTKPEARNAGYGLVGAAIGVGAIATAVGMTGPQETRKAARYFYEFAENCRDQPQMLMVPPTTPARPNAPGPAEAAPGPPTGQPYTPPPEPQY